MHHGGVRGELAAFPTLAPLLSKLLRRITCKRRAEHPMRLHSVKDWVTEQRRLRWGLAAQVAARPVTRWTQRAVQWHPSHTANKATYRKHGGQHKRWDDEIRTFLGQHVRDDAISGIEQRGRGDMNDTL